MTLPLWQTCAALFVQFALISVLAFGGGQAVLPLMERICVTQYGWLSASAFTTGIGFGYLVPGPTMTVAAFIGYRAAGFPGAVCAALGIFLPTILLGGVAAAGVGRVANNRFVRAFGVAASPAVVGLLAATAWSIAQHAVSTWQLALIAAASTLLAARTKLSPIWLLTGGALVHYVLFLAIR